MKLRDPCSRRKSWQELERTLKEEKDPKGRRSVSIGGRAFLRDGFNRGKSGEKLS